MNINKYIQIVILILFGILITITIRNIIYAGLIFKTNDEAHYTVGLSLISKFSVFDLKHTIVSGSGYLYLLEVLKKLNNFDIITTIGVFSSIISLLYPLIIYGNYHFLFKNHKFSFLSLIPLLFSSYFIFPMIEGRPQQIGMLLVLSFFIFYYKFIDTNNRNSAFVYYYLCFILIIITFVIHILSFFLLFTLFYLNSLVTSFLIKTNKIKLIGLILPFTLCFIYFFISNSIFNATSGAIKWSLMQSSNILIRYIGNNFRELGVIITILSAIFLIPLTKLVENSGKNLHTLFLRARELILKYKKYIFIFLIVITLFFILLQFIYLINTAETAVYKRSILLYSILNIGNFLFGIFYLRAIIRFLENFKSSKQLMYLFSISLILTLIIASGILISYSMLPNFNNFGIRFINYWTIFSSPIVAIEMLNFIHNKKINIFLLAITIIVLIFLGTINASRGPQFFDYSSYWTKNDIITLNWLVENNNPNLQYFIIPEIRSKYNTYNYLIEFYKTEKNLTNVKALFSNNISITGYYDLIYSNYKSKIFGS
jgi:hypothetical protein